MKNLLNLGKALNKSEQQKINGGGRECPTGLCQFRGGSCRPCSQDEPPNQ